MLTVYDVMPEEFRAALSDPTVTDIAIRDNGHGYITKLGGYVDIGFQADKIPLMLCLAASAAGTVINDETPTLECKLPNGQRLVGKRPEVGGKWTLTIRSPIGRRLTWGELVAYGTLTQGQADWLEARVAGGDSGIIAGSMGSGKTTLLNVMLGSPSLASKPAVKIEAVEELIGTPMCTTYVIGHHCSMETARAKALRESVKLFIVGEARDGHEMREVMTTLSTGHQSFTTLHADDIEQVPYRIENMLRQLPEGRSQQQIHEDIVRNVDFCVFMKEREGGARIITDIASFEMQGRKAVKTAALITTTTEG